MLDGKYLAAIKSFEGYSPRAQWDYAQHTNGYGTKARAPGEVIDRAEADRRFADEISAAAELVDAFAPNLDPGTRAALTSLTFNAGTTWMKSGLGQAVLSGDLSAARDIFLQYNKAGGEVLGGLTNRRAAEATWFASGAPGVEWAASSIPSSVPAGAAMAAAGQQIATAVFRESSPAMNAGAFKTDLASQLSNGQFGGPVGVMAKSAATQDAAADIYVMNLIALLMDRNGQSFINE